MKLLTRRFNRYVFAPAILMSVLDLPITVLEVSRESAGVEGIR